MSHPKPFLLDARTLAKHAAGALLCLAPTARGQEFTLLQARPGPPIPWALQGRRADSQVWAPVAGSPIKAAHPRDDDDVDSDYDPDSDEAMPSSVPGGPRSSQGSAGDPALVHVVEVRGLLASEVTERLCGFQDGYHGEGGIIDRVQDALAARPAALVVDIDSPGGMAKGCGEAAAELMRLVAESSVPVCVYAREAASAGYALASALASAGACLCVSESSDVGCIGTWRAHVDQSKANEQEGLEVTIIEDPPGKAAGNPHAPLSDEARDRMERDVRESTDRFCAQVLACRPGMSDPRALRGDVRRGQAAVDTGLADVLVRGLQDVVQLAYSRALLASPLTLTTGAP